ncbi:MAG: hypothetical protein IPH07_33370 [Deltaproteobacteria bacterium]|nr:hypothetical protein [Deltaproteobacteria bacterium]MBK8235073.1 hypothetical protein [Deltaproteobacteria bacterium]MBK8716612.1 hypothetical protein [Deltaproteobacteria bacterium]MBP7290208.1 hypothetical protein [Nannocystaceae bacterium]
MQRYFLTLLIVICPACKGPVPGPAPGPSEGEDCSVARVGTYTLDARRVAEIRSQYVPAPPKSEATALAIDVLTAEWVSSGTLGQLTPREAVRNYRGFMVGRMAQVPHSTIVAELTSARGELGFERLSPPASCLEQI